MKVGYYVRTDDGFISKYIGKNKNKWCARGHLSFESTIRDIRFEDLDEDNIIWESEIKQGFVKIKSSPNIIDLIEEDDYVNGKLVVDIVTNENGKRLHLNMYPYQKIKNEDIKSIVTREMFESMEYKVKE